MMMTDLPNNQDDVEDDEHPHAGLVHICIHAYVCVCVCVCVYICMYVCIYIYIYIYMHVCGYITSDASCVFGPMCN